MLSRPDTGKLVYLDELVIIATSTRRKAAVHTTAIVEVTFGASPVGLAASSIQLQVENMGNTPTQW